MPELAMESVARRPWEATPIAPQSQKPPPQKLPSISTLVPNMEGPTSESNTANGVRSSAGSWSLPPTSAPSSNPMPYLTSGQSPNRFSAQSGSQSSPYTPDTPSGPSPSFLSSQNQTLPSMNAHFDTTQLRGSGDFHDSRRSSVDSRMHQGMDKLALGPTSPYASANVSQTSLASSHLQRERGILTNGFRGPRYSAGPISPFGSRSADARAFVAGRVAPPILENPRPEIYNAAEPSAGQPYAFPDPDAQPVSANSRISRRGSFASSITSSIYTLEGSTRHLPPGQQELPTHHHQLQHRTVRDLIEDPESPNGSTPYSRTPELRVTHKLAERKRRSEMKDCFDLLRARLPPGQNNKSSKWETLMRAIDHIVNLDNQIKSFRLENDQLRTQMSDMEVKMQEMSQQLQRLHSASASYTTPPPNTLSTSPMGFGNHYTNGIEGSNERTLPPLVNGAAMQGVQYSDDNVGRVR